MVAIIIAAFIVGLSIVAVAKYWWDVRLEDSRTRRYLGDLEAERHRAPRAEEAQRLVDAAVAKALETHRKGLESLQQDIKDARSRAAQTPKRFPG